MPERRSIQGVEQQPTYPLISKVIEGFLKYLEEPREPDFIVHSRPVPADTKTLYKYDLTAFMEICNNHSITTIERITPELTGEFKQWQKQKQASDNTIARRLRTLRRLVKFAITSNPNFTTETRYALLRTVGIPFLTAEEVEKLSQEIALRLKVATRPNLPYELKGVLAVRIPLLTTATLAEMAGLRFPDFKSVDQKPTVTLRRGNHNLQIPIDTSLFETITKFKKIRGATADDYLFRNRNTPDGDSVPTESGVGLIINAYTSKISDDGKSISSRALSNTYWAQKPTASSFTFHSSH